jgi:hypothetical protein
MLHLYPKTNIMKKVISNLMLTLGLGLTSFVSAQETWYFDAGGLKFNGAIVTSSPPPSGALLANEPSSVLVDNGNNVIMYTNGVRLWNGAGALQYVGLQSNTSSAQGAQIVPIPSSNRAFIFTLRNAEHCYGLGHGTYGLLVSLVDYAGTAPGTAVNMLSANQRLTPVNLPMGEKMSVIEDGNGGYWVLVHGIGVATAMPGTPGITWHSNAARNTFYAYHVQCSTTDVPALLATQVISTIQDPNFAHNSWPHPTTTSFSMTATTQLNGAGQMKMIRTGATTAKIACTLPWAGNNNYTFSPMAQLYDFNLSNGMVAGGTAVQFPLGFDNTMTNARDGIAFGLEFSPTGNYLYVSGALSTSTPSITYTPRIYRYDISAGLPPAPQVTATLPVASVHRFGMLQRGPNGRIYIARPGLNVIDEIASPDAALPGAVGYATGIPVGGICNLGLPNRVFTAHSGHTPLLLGPATICSGQPLTFVGFSSGQPPSAHFWEMYGSNSAGFPVDGSGALVANTSLAFYNFQSWTAGPPTGSYTFPTTSGVLCNKYYTIKLALTDGCGSWTEVIKTFYIQCSPTPVISSSLPNPVLWGSTVTLCANYTPSSSAPVTVNDWANNFVNYPSPADNLQCITVNPTTNTTYTVTVTQDGCTGTGSYYLHMGQSHSMSDMPLTSEEVVPVEATQKIEGGTPPFLSVKPNPSNGVFSAVSNEGDFDELRVYDSFGRLVFSSITPQAGTLEIDLSKFEKGLYFVTAISDGKQETQKVIVQ